jgi:hypothetical protein
MKVWIPHSTFAETGPATGALVIAVAGCARTRPAADGTITAVVKRVIGNFVVANVFPNGVTRPVGHGI